jgi:hypothetical protein
MKKRVQVSQVEEKYEAMVMLKTLNGKQEP